MGEAAAPDGISLVLCLFHLVCVCGWGGTNVVHAVGFGKESLFGSLLMSSMAHVEGILCMGRRGGEIGDVGSNLGFFLIHVEELKALGGVGFVEV